jgi:hypothetical protein
MPAPSAWRELLAQATRVRLVAGGVIDGEPMGTEVRAELAADPALLEAFAIREPREPFHCLCRGDHALQLLDGARAVATVGLHHGQSIRVHGWDSDAYLAEPERALTWLAERGYPQPLADWRAARAAAEAADAQERAFRAAMPPVLAPLLHTVIDGVIGGPRVRSHPAWRPAMTALTAAHGSEGGAVVALCTWLAAARAEWSPHPAIEEVPLTLIDLYGPAALAQAAGAGAPLASVARAFAVASWSRATLRDAAAPFADRLRAAVAHRSAADRARLEAVLRPAPSITVEGDAVLVGRTIHQPARGLALHLGSLFACDGAELVGFDAAATRHVLAPISEGHVTLAADERQLLVADMKQARVGRFDRETRELSVLVDDEARPMYPGLDDAGRPAWMSCAHPPAPTRVRTVDGGSACTLAEWVEPAAWDGVVTPAGVACVVREEARGLLGGSRRVARLRLTSWRGEVTTVATLADPVLASLHVRLAFCYRAFFWTGKAPRELWTLREGDRPRRLARLPADPVALTADERGAVVIVADGDHHTILDIPHAGTITAVGRYLRRGGPLPELVCSAYGCFVALDHEIVRVPRAERLPASSTG